MDTKAAKSSSPPPRARRAGRGETGVVSVGLALAMLLLLAAGATAWLNAQALRRDMADVRLEGARGVAHSVGGAARRLLADGDLPGLQRLVVEVADGKAVAACQVVVADQRIVAHSDAQRITDTVLPGSWRDRPLSPVRPVPATGQELVSVPVDVPGRGAARVDLIAAAMDAATWREASAGTIGLVGAAALLGLLLVYRRMRVRMGTLLIIRDSLLALAGGERRYDLLRVPADLGRDAAAWNRLLEERSGLEQRLLDRRVDEALEARRRGSGDLDRACDVIRQGMILVDRDLEISYANGAAAACLGRERDVLIGSPIAGALADERLLEALRMASSGRTRTWTTIETQLQGDATGSGSGTVLRFSTRPLRESDSSAAIVIIEDVTQQRIAERSRNAFVTQVTHELRSPLTNIQLYAEAAMTDGEDDAALRQRSLNVINQEAKRLDRVVSDMLSISEMEAGSYRLDLDDVRLEDVFARLTEDFGAAARDKAMDLRFDLPPKLPVIRADREKVVLSLHNIIGNAIKYTPREGRVAVRAQVDEHEFVVEVSDSGVGIHPDEQERIFDRFYRANDRRISDEVGSGLGLALAREVARLHGGDVTVESQIDKGSTFILTIPLRAAHAKAA